MGRRDASSAASCASSAIKSHTTASWQNLPQHSVDFIYLQVIGDTQSWGTKATVKISKECPATCLWGGCLPQACRVMASRDYLRVVGMLVPLNMTSCPARMPAPYGPSKGLYQPQTPIMRINPASRPDLSGENKSACPPTPRRERRLDAKTQQRAQSTGPRPTRSHDGSAPPPRE
jgi:hypothetical protein